MVINGRGRCFGSTKGMYWNIILGCLVLFSFFFIMAFSLAKFKSYFQRDGMGEGTQVCFVPLEEKLILVIME